MHLLKHTASAVHWLFRKGAVDVPLIRFRTHPGRPSPDGANGQFASAGMTTTGLGGVERELIAHRTEQQTLESAEPSGADDDEIIFTRFGHHGGGSRPGHDPAHDGRKAREVDSIELVVEQLSGGLLHQVDVDGQLQASA